MDGTYRCSGCCWPLCSPACKEVEGNWHYPSECNLLAAQHVYPTAEELTKEDCQIYDCITPLRVVMAIQQDEKKRVALTGLEHHLRHRQDVGIWEVDQLSVVHIIRIDWGLGDSISEDELQMAW